jgi:polyhydroxyalkanoate synthesis regulator phasin
MVQDPPKKLRISVSDEEVDAPAQPASITLSDEEVAPPAAMPGKPLAPSASTASPSTLAGGSGAAVSSAAGPTKYELPTEAELDARPALSVEQLDAINENYYGYELPLRAAQIKQARKDVDYYADKFVDLDLPGVAKVKEELATKRTTLDELRLKAEAQLKGFEKLKGQELSPEQQAFANSEIQNYNERVKAIQDLTTASDRDEQMALRREYDIKSQQGSLLGATHNFIQQGIGPLAALPISVLIDMTAQGLPASMLPASEEDINTKSRDQLAKEWKRSILPLVREAPMAAFGDAGTTPEYMQELEGSLFGGAWAGLARSAPAMVTPAMIGIFAQTTDGVMKEMEAPEHDDIPEAEKWAVAAPVGVVTMLLERAGFRNLATNNAATKNILAQVLDKVPANATKEEVQRILNAETQSAAKNYLIRAAGGFVAEAETGGLQEIADVSIKDIYNKVKGTEVLNNPDTWGEFGADVLKASFQEGIGGFILSQPHAVSAARKNNAVGATANDRQFQTLEAMMRDPSYEAAFKQFTESRVENGDITREQADEALTDWDISKKIVARIPGDLDTPKRREAFDLLAKKEKLSKMEPDLVRSKLDKIKEQLAELSNEPEPPKPTADGKTPEPRVATQEEVDGALTPPQQPKDGSTEPTVGATDTGVAPVPAPTPTDTDPAPSVPDQGTPPAEVRPAAEVEIIYTRDIPDDIESLAAAYLADRVDHYNHPEATFADLLAAGVNPASYKRWGDQNNINKGLAKQYLRNSGGDLDVIADEASDILKREVTPGELVEFMDANKSGRPMRSKSMVELDQRYGAKTGKKLNSLVAKKIVAEAKAKEAGKPVDTNWTFEEREIVKAIGEHDLDIGDARDEDVNEFDNMSDADAETLYGDGSTIAKFDLNAGRRKEQVQSGATREDAGAARSEANAGATVSKQRDPELDRLADAAKQARAERDRFLEDWNDRGTGLFAPEDNPSIQSSIDETIDNSKENFDAKLEPLNERVRQADKALADYVSKAADRAKAAAQQTRIDDAGTSTLSAKSLQDAFGYTKEVAEATEAIADAMGLDKSKITIAKGGTPASDALFQKEVDDVVGGWYSRLDKAVAAKGNTQSGADWMKWAEARAKEGALSMEEVKWTGLEAFLQGKAKVTPEQVREFLSENRVRVEVKELRSDEFGKVDTSQFGGIDDIGDLEPVGNTQGGATKFSQYQLPGGTNYREVLVTLPPIKPQGILPGPAYDALIAALKETGSRFPNTDFDAIRQWYASEELRSATGLSSTQQLRKEAAIRAMARLRDAGRGQLLDDYSKSFEVEKQFANARDKQFRSTHFDEPNILVHLRLNDRTDADGKKVLFIEEMQSDWGQQGKKKGFAGRPIEELKADAAQAERDAIVAEQAFYANKDDAKQKELGIAMDAAWDKSARALKAVNEAAGKLPPAPFVTSTNSWVELGLKQAIRMAVEGGYDRIAWANGAQQVNHYREALQKNVDRIEWTKTANGIQLLGSKNGVKTVDTTESESALSDAIGKRMGDKIINDPGQSGVIEGDDITISDTGMAGFYDKILPTTAKKVSKKMGGDGVVGDVNFGQEKSQWQVVNTKTGAVIARFGFKPTQERLKSDYGSGMTDGRFRLEEVAVPKEANEVGAQQSITITPEMKAKVMEGVPLMQGNKGSVEFTHGGEAVIRALENPNASTGIHELAHVARRFLFDKSVPKDNRAGITDEHITTAEAWAGANDGKWTKEAEEKFARGFERYMRYGAAPSPALKNIFKKFADWLTDIYSTLTGSAIDVEVSPEMTKVFDALVTRGGKRPPSVGRTSTGTPPSTSLADQIRKLKIDPNITGSFIIPPQLFNAAVEVVAKAIEAGVAVGKAIADGIRHIQQSAWYKGLTPSEQQRAEKQFTTPLAEFEKEQQRKAAPKAFNAVSDDIRGQFRLAARSAREAVGDLKSRQRQFAAQVGEVLKDLKGKVSPAQVSALVTRALKTNLDNPKAVAQYMNYAARVVADVNYAKDLVEAKVMRKRASKMSRRTTVPLNHRQALASIAAIDVTMIEDPKAYSDAVTDYLKTFAPESKGYQPGSSAAIIGMSERLQGQVDAAYRGLIADEHGVDETDGITPKQLYDALESDDIDAHSNSLSAAKAKALNDVLGRMAEYSKIGLREHDISDATPEQQKYVKDLLAVDIARLSPQQRKEYIRTVDNIVINDSFNGAARTAIMARNTQAMASALGTVANTPIPNVTLRKFRDTISSVSDVPTFLYGLSQTMAKIQERMGLGDFRRAKKKWSDEMKDVGKKMADFYTALHKKHKDIYRREALTAEGMVANAIQQVPGYDPIASFAIRKEIIEQDIAAKEEMRDHKKEAAIARVEFDELLKNAKTPEEAMAGLKARYPGNHKSIEFLKELFRPYKDALRQHTEDFWNEGGTWDDPNYLPVRYKNAPDQTIADPEDAPRSSDLAGSMYKPDRAAGTIARAPTLRLPKGRLLDYNVRHNAYRSMSRNLWDLNTSAPWEAIRQFLKMPEANKVFGSADNKSFVTQRMNRYMNRQFQNDPNDAMSNILNGMASGLRSWAAARALGGVLQLPKQLTDTVVNTTINLGGRFDRIVSMIPHIREAKGLLSKYPIGDRGNIEGGTKWEGRLMAHIDELEGAIEHGALSRIKAASKKIGHAWMFSLTAGDALGAKSSWMAYYEKARAEQGHKITSWKEESDLHDYDIERQEAGTFAETMTSRSQASSDASEMAQISQRGVSGWENMGKAIAFPFSSFSMQALSRKAADLHNLGYAAKLLADGNKGGALARDPAASARSLTGTVLGGVAYAAISVWAVRAANEAAANAILQGIVGGADDEDEDKAMVRLATAVEVLYTMGLMDADVYRAISKAQRLALETTAQKKRREKDNRKAGQTEEQRQAVKKVREWKARVVTDLIASGAQTTISNALIDNINRVEYYTLVANDDPSVMKAHKRGQPDEPVEFSYWQKNPSNTMLYRPGQGGDAGDVDLGMLDVVLQRGESLTNQAKLWYEYEIKD